MNARDRIWNAVAGARLEGRWFRVPCPFCIDAGHKDKKTSLGVRADTGRFHCFRCGTKGRLREPPVPSLEELPEEPRVPIVLPEHFTPLYQGSGTAAECLREAREYLAERRVSHATGLAVGIGACFAGYHCGRVVVPMYEPDGELVGWSSRLWTRPPDGAEGPQSLPYLYPKGMRRVLFNGAVLSETTDVPALLVEGVFDALGYWPRAVAVLGKPTRAQVEQLKNAQRPIAVVLDGDAWEEGWALAMRLRFEGLTAGAVRLPPKTDPDEVDPMWLTEEARRCLSQ